MTGHSPLDTVHSLPVTQAYFSLPRHSIVCLVVWSSSSLSLSRLVRGFAVVHLYTVTASSYIGHWTTARTSKRALDANGVCMYVCVVGATLVFAAAVKEGKQKTGNGKTENGGVCCDYAVCHI